MVCKKCNGTGIYNTFECNGYYYNGNESLRPLRLKCNSCNGQGVKQVKQ